MAKVVALGGGHGLSKVLKSLRLIPEVDISAIVSVADDGGSSGRLRNDLDVVAPGDVRSCLLALSDIDETSSFHEEMRMIRDVFGYRFDTGELDGHSLGNLILVALARKLGSFESAVEEASKLLNVRGHVLPATESSVVLCAETKSGLVRGQVEIEKCRGIERVYLDPADALPLEGVVKALAEADNILYAPGNLFTSLIPVIVIPEISRTLNEVDAKITMILNLSNRGPDTADLNGNEHLNKVIQHGGRIDQVIFDTNCLTADSNEKIDCISEVLSYDSETHDAKLLAQALEKIIF